MRRQSSQVAVGGVFSALCLVIMMLTVMPFGTYALPAFAGAMLIPVVIEVGTKTAVMVYASVSLLSIFIVPDLEATMLFVAFFGYYPIVKDKLEKRTPAKIAWIVKLMLFNTAVVSGYYVVLRVIGIARLVEEFGEFGRYGLILMLAMGNAYFILYDIAMTRYTAVYIHRFRKKFLRW